jgi:tellurite resistance protein TerC
MQSWASCLPQPARMIVVAAVGLVVLLIGVALLPLPGPGSVIMALGLMILAIEFTWARRWLRRGKVTMFRTWQRTRQLAVQCVQNRNPAR